MDSCFLLLMYVVCMFQEMETTSAKNRFAAGQRFRRHRKIFTRSLHFETFGQQRRPELVPKSGDVFYSRLSQIWNHILCARVRWQSFVYVRRELTTKISLHPVKGENFNDSWFMLVNRGSHLGLLRRWKRQCQPQDKQYASRLSSSQSWIPIDLR